MSEENEKGGEGFTAITSQEQLDRLIGERINKVKSSFADYDDLKAKAAKFDEAEQASKSELEKEREARAAAEKERDRLQLEGVRASVALAKGLTPTQAKRLVGSTKEELEADADELLADLGASKGAKPKPDHKRTQSGSSSSGDSGLTGKERAAALLRDYRAASH